MLAIFGGLRLHAIVMMAGIREELDQCDVEGVAGTCHHVDYGGDFWRWRFWAFRVWTAGSRPLIEDLQTR